MKIAYLISKYPAISHTFIQREISILRKIGWSVQTVSVNEPDAAPDGSPSDYSQELENTFVIKRRILRASLQAVVWALFRKPASTLKLLKFLLANQPTFKSWLYAIEALVLAHWIERHKQALLHVHFGNAAASVGLYASIFSGCRFTMTVHGPDEFEQAQAQQMGLKIRHAERVICISRYARQQAMRNSRPEDWSKIIVCPLGVDANEFAFMESRKTAGPLKLLCVGRLCAAKGQHILLHAIDQLRSQGVDCMLDLVGDGPDRCSLEATVKSLNLQQQVNFHGAVGIAQVRNFMRQANLFVLPSFAEGVPVVLMEAMASGLPCITTSITGIPELIEHDHSGLLVPAGDTEALTLQISRLSSDHELSLTLARNARAKVLGYYNLEQNVRRLSALLAS